eukprot:3941807-Rhodomonas_salina.1
MSVQSTRVGRYSAVYVSTGDPVVYATVVPQCTMPVQSIAYADAGMLPDYEPMPSSARFVRRTATCRAPDTLGQYRTSHSGRAGRVYRCADWVREGESGRGRTGGGMREGE